MDVDVVVIGGGPAGSTTAGFLTQMGRSVLVLEREQFPRHHIGESMIASTFDVLAEIGLEPKIQAAGFPVKSGGCFIWGESLDPWCIRFSEIPGRPTSFQVKRDVFDTILLDHAAELGADVRQQARVNEVLVEDGRVVGVRFEHESEVHEVRAGCVVDASGLAAVVANKVSSREPVEGLKNMALYGYWKGVHPAPAALGGDLKPDDRNNIIIKMLDTGWLWFIPLGFDDVISVGYVTHRANLPEKTGKAGLEEHYLEQIQASEEISYLLSNSTYTDDFHTVKDWSYRSADMQGPGFFAVGDAACFVDPILSSGVYLGVLFAKMCALAVNTCLSEPENEALIGDWYQGLYVDAYSDYVDMADLWYHGDRRVQSWMASAHDNLAQEVAGEFTEDDRSSFIGLATGNAHSHANYVLQRELESFPLPLYLRKDPRAGFHQAAHHALIAHADPATLEEDGLAAKRDAQQSLDSSAARRAKVAALLAGPESLVDALQPTEPAPPLSEDARLALSSEVRLSLEAIGNMVRMVLTAPDGQRRILSSDEQRLIAALGEGPSLGQLNNGSDTGNGADGFVNELLGAGALVAG
ncbi:MAG TPA: NAD(P)/FAD-dependent oxidoreductase [Acidimicrobiia bacterium]|nr:NAD(P)/FAD-dependent oxidoreductase [Acidimicrobiia bacterium]